MITAIQPIKMKLPKPTEEQAEILANKSQCKLIIAAPGSGKSTLLLQAIQQHYSRNNAKGHCLLLTFSKKSNQENQAKIRHFFITQKKLIKVQTFDAFSAIQTIAAQPTNQ